MRIDSEFTAAHEQTLRSQVFDNTSPGPLLHDFQVLLDFLGSESVKAVGKHNLLPLEAIPVLDERLTRPLRLQLKRPLLCSHPYLQGLHLLLRASGLARVQGSGSKTRLAPDPAMLQQWQGLNTTERYFALLEAWLLVSQPEMVGERGGRGNQFLHDCLLEWRLIPAGGRIIGTGGGRPEFVYLRGIGRQFYLLALLDLFGLLRIDHPEVPVKPWMPAGLNRTPFGDAAFTLLAHTHFRLLFTIPPGGHHREATDEPAEHVGLSDEGLLSDEPAGQALADELTATSTPAQMADAGSADDGGWYDLPREDVGFGFWQPLFQPYVPAWQTCLSLAASPPRTGVFVFRVSLGEARREIALPDDATLDHLVSWILRSVNFDSEHLYEISYRDHLGRSVRALHPYCEEGPSCDDIRLGDLPLEPGRSMRLVYDFGDNWEFDVRLERIEAASGKKRAPRIVSRQGVAPQQYSSW